MKLTPLTRLAVTPLEAALNAIESDRAHYQALLDACDQRIEDAKAQFAPEIGATLRDAGVLAADEAIDTFTLTQDADGKAVATEVATKKS